MLLANLLLANLDLVVGLFVLGLIITGPIIVLVGIFIEKKRLKKHAPGLLILQKGLETATAQFKLIKDFKLGDPVPATNQYKLAQYWLAKGKLACFPNRRFHDARSYAEDGLRCLELCNNNLKDFEQEQDHSALIHRQWTVS